LYKATYRSAIVDSLRTGTRLKRPESKKLSQCAN